MAKFLRVILALAVLTLPLSARRVNTQITINSGVPVRISNTHLTVNRIFIEVKSGAGGTVYVMDGIPDGTTPSYSNAAHVTAELCLSGCAGASYSDPQNGGGNSQTGLPDLSRIWIDGTNSGDIVIVSYDVRE